MDGTLEYEPAIGDTVLYTTQRGVSRPAIITNLTEAVIDEVPTLRVDVAVFVRGDDDNFGPKLARITNNVCEGTAIEFGLTPFESERLTPKPISGTIPTLTWSGKRAAEVEVVEGPDGDPRPSEETEEARAD